MNSNDPGGSYGAAMDGNDPMTQYYLQMAEDAVSQQRQGQGQQQQDRPPSSPTPAEVEAAMHILQSTTSGDIYEGDDELNEDSTLAQSHSATQTGPDDTEGEPESQETVDVANSNTADGTETETDEVQVLSVGNSDEAAVDFVHVHLEHLPSGDDLLEGSQPAAGPQSQYILSTGSDPNGNGLSPTRFTYYRKFASQGSPPPQEKETTGSAEDGTWHPPHLPNASPSMEESTINPMSQRTHLTSIGDSLRAIRGDRPGHPLPPSAQPDGFQRQKALQGDLAQNTAATFPYISQQSAGDSSRFNSGDEQELQNNFDFVNMSVSHPLHTSPTLQTSPSQQSQGAVMMRPDPSSNKQGAYEPPGTRSESQIRKESEGANLKNAFAAAAKEAKEVHFSASGDDDRYASMSADIDHSHSEAISHTHTYTSASEGDEETFTAATLRRARQETEERQRQEREERQERLLRRRDEKFRMTILQTMQHNTRANFCTVFLLGVAMATLILLIVAKVTSSSKDDLYYDEDGQKTYIINNERLLTLEVLAFALITVLLVGSLCYLGFATHDTNNSLVKAVKHEDACLANASARRKHPTYKAPYVQDGGPKRVRHYGAGRIQGPPAVDIHLEHNTTGASSENQEYNQSFSIVSSGTGTDRSHGDDDQELISMEEADRIYREEADLLYREMEDRGVCSCSPISYHPSTEEIVEMPTYDDGSTIDRR